MIARLADRVLKLVTDESLKMKTEYEANLRKRQEELQARASCKASPARQRRALENS